MTIRATFNKNNKNIIAIISSIVILGGTFLPFFSMTLFGSTLSKPIIESKYGWIFLVLAGIGLIAGLRNSILLMLISGVTTIACLYTTYSNIFKSAYDEEITQMMGRELVERGAGFYTILIGGIVLILSIFLVKKSQ